MFEFHGWFKLLDSPYENDLEQLDAFVERLRDRVAVLDWPEGLAWAEVQTLNGLYYLLVAGNRNYRGRTGKELNELLAFVVAEAPGSSGLLYWRDDEAEPPAGPDAYQVTVMEQGTLTLRLDPFLSFNAPTVEDEEPFEE